MRLWSMFDVDAATKPRSQTRAIPCACLWLALSLTVLSNRSAVAQSSGIEHWLEPTTSRILRWDSIGLTRPPRNQTAVQGDANGQLNFQAGQRDIRVIPYGSLWGSMIFSTERTSPGPFTLWVFSREDHGEETFEIDARRTRLGVHVDGGPLSLGDAELSMGGRIEFDFFGQFLIQNRAGARMRHAYWEAKNSDWRLLVGQTWDVISPLRPGTLNFSVGWAGGNIGFRRAQFRVERTLHLTDEVEMQLQTSLNQDIIDDFPSTPGVRPESANYPVLEGRMAWAWASWLEPRRPVIIGLSGHYGETGFDFLTVGPPPLNLPPENDVRIETWSINADFELPLGERTTFRGEFFHGANLSPFLGGIGQGVCPCLRIPIHSTGGWLELVRSWSPAWQTHIGMGLDDPRNSDALLGRVQNSFIFGNLIWNVADGLSTGWEVSWWKTLYQERREGLISPAELTPSEPGTAFTIEWMVRYNF